MATTKSFSLSKLSTLTTLVDAALAFARGRRKSGVLLLVAAAVSSRVKGLGTVVSILLRLVRRFR